MRPFFLYLFLKKMALYPNNECLLFCNWLLTPNLFRFSGPRLAIIQTVQSAANTTTPVSNNIWKNFNMITSPLYSRYRQFVDLITVSLGIELFMIAGGGGGGGFGGGGAGGYIYNNALSLAIGTYPIVIGTGGAGATAYGLQGTNGTNTTFTGLIAYGGGGGGAYDNSLMNGLNGGCGGGGGCRLSGSPYYGSGGIGSQGFNGGKGDPTPNAYSSSGGGGIGASANDVVTSGVATNGGAGLQFAISGTSLFYGAGGGGSGTISKGLGGSLIGGNGALYLGTAPSSPTPNTGSGGGGSYASTDATAGSNGTLIISYVTGTIVCTGGTITTSAGKTIHTFTTNGTFDRIS